MNEREFFDSFTNNYIKNILLYVYERYAVVFAAYTIFVCNYYNYRNIVPFINTPNYIDIHAHIYFLINPADYFEHSENK